MRMRVLAALAAMMAGMGSVTMAQAQRQQTQLVRVANEAMARWPDGASPNWDFTLGIELAGINAAWQRTQDKAYLNYIQHVIDRFVQADGSIKSYKLEDYSLNNLLLGRQLLLLYGVTHQERYARAAGVLRSQLETQPHTASGGFWHAQATPNLMLTDDLFMEAPFWAEYADMFHARGDMSAIAKQFALLDQHARDAQSGLLLHAWDESKKAGWANAKMGTSANVWARGMGWYLMALVDTLPYYAKNDPGREQLLDILNRQAAALVARQDPQTGLWYQLIDKPEVKENYIESSSVMMFAYALAEGARQGFLPREYGVAAERAWAGIEQRFVKTGADGSITLTGTVTGIAMGAAPANDGSDGYYLHAPVVSDDAKAVGPFLMAAALLERR